MERKDKPKVPAKPRNLSVAEKTRHFERVVAEITDVIGIKISMSEKDISEANIRNNSTESTDKIVHIIDADETDITEQFMNDDSIDDSVYFGTEDIDTEDIDTEDFGENIYDEISEAPGVTNIVDEIIAVEEFYIERLNYAVNNYVEPSRLMGDQMKAVFGNMEEIKKFHEDTFYPDLKQCNKDLIRILECFSKHISAGNFYIYVVYSMNKKRSDEERNKPAFKSFFEERRNKIGDKLGLHSLLTEPFQRFFKYQNLIESLLKKIKNNELNFMEIAATSKALHDVKKLLNTANKSMALTEVIDSKINLQNQGNFLTQNEFTIYDHNQKRKYKGNIFVFQHCVVCTERISSAKLQFKGYFPSGTSHTECINENKFLLYERNNYKIEISGDATVIQQMMKEVRQVLSSNRENRISTLSNVTYIKTTESKVPTQQMTKELELPLEHRQRSASFDSMNFLSDRETNTTSSVIDNRKSNSDGSSVESDTGVIGGEYGGSDDCDEKHQFRQMIKNFDKFYEKVTNKTPTSTVLLHEEILTLTTTVVHVHVHQSSAEIIQEMLTNESDYVRQLTVGIQTYLTHDHANITEAVKGKIIKIFGNIQQIRDFHENTFYSYLSDCRNDVTKIANVFIKFTQEGLFSNYILYAMNHSNTQSIRSMRQYREFFEVRRKSVDSEGVEYYLFLPFQHLSKYQSFMDRIINTLNIDTDTAVMAACSKAMKNVERLIKDIHSSWTTSDVYVRKRPIRKLSNLVLNGIQNIRRH